MSLSVLELITRLNKKSPDLNLLCKGSSDVLLTGVSPVGEATSSQLSWINPNRKDASELIRQAKAGALIVSRETSISYPGTLLLVGNPQLAFALSISELHEEAALKVNPGIHPTAIVDPEAKLHPSVSVGAYCVIGPCRIGARSVIESHVRIEGQAEIGEDCRIYSFCSIGGEGFGFVRDDQGVPQRMPHIGRVIIGDRVSVLHHSNIDRPTLGVTRIGSDVKIDHYCHIGHNCSIGRGSMLAAGLITCGGSQVGDFSFLGAHCTINDSVRVGSRVSVGSGSVITKNIPDGESWAGSPAKPLHELKAQLAALKKMSSSHS